MTVRPYLLALLLACGCASHRPFVVGQTLDLQLPAMDGGEVDLTKYRGQVVLLDVWASWCHPCAEAVPFYADLQKRLGGRGLRVVAVNIDADPRAAQAFLADVSKGDTPVLRDGKVQKIPAADLDVGHSLVQARDPEGKLVTARFKLRRMPSMLLLDRTGTVRKAHDGFDADDMAKIEHEVEEMLAAKGT